MNAAKKALVRTQKFVADHKVALAVTTTAATTAAVMTKLHKGATAVYDEFLAERNLSEEFINFVADKTL